MSNSAVENIGKSISESISEQLKVHHKKIIEAMKAMENRLSKKQSACPIGLAIKKAIEELPPDQVTEGDAEGDVEEDVVEDVEGDADAELVGRRLTVSLSRLRK